MDRGRICHLNVCTHQWVGEFPPLADAMMHLGPPSHLHDTVNVRGEKCFFSDEIEIEQIANLMILMKIKSQF